MAAGNWSWRAGAGPKADRTPHYFTAADGSLLAFAGLWEHRVEDGKDVITCTIITRDSDEWMGQFHNRMPCMLHPDDFEAWLDLSGDKELLMRPPRAMREWIVSKRMNKTGEGDDDPATIKPA